MEGRAESKRALGKGSRCRPFASAYRGEHMNSQSVTQSLFLFASLAAYLRPKPNMKKAIAWVYRGTEMVVYESSRFRILRIIHIVRLLPVPRVPRGTGLVCVTAAQASATAGVSVSHQCFRVCRAPSDGTSPCRIYVLTVTMATCFRHRMFIYTVIYIARGEPKAKQSEEAAFAWCCDEFSGHAYPGSPFDALPPPSDAEMRTNPKAFFLPRFSSAEEENFYELNVTHD